MYHCKICSKDFVKHTSLAAHMICHTPRKTCEVCGAQVACNVLQSHMRIHTQNRQCLNCGKLIRKGKFCSHSCCAKYTNPLRIRIKEKSNLCIVCGKETRNIYCSYKCQHQYEYVAYIEKWLGGEVSGNCDSDDTVSLHVRRWVLERAKNKCEQCGWAKINPFTNRTPLNVHHKDGNPFRTVPENLEALCPCCHSLTNTYGSLNIGNGRNKRRLMRKIKDKSI